MIIFESRTLQFCSPHSDLDRPDATLRAENWNFYFRRG